MRRSVQRKSNPALTFLAKQSLCDGPLDRCSVKPSRLGNAERSREMRLYGAGGGVGRGGSPSFPCAAPGRGGSRPATPGWEPISKPCLGKGNGNGRGRGRENCTEPTRSRHGTARPASFFSFFPFFLFFFFFFFLVLRSNTLQQRNWKSCLKVGHSSAVSIETSSQRAVRLTGTGGAPRRPYSRLSPLTLVLRSTLWGHRGHTVLPGPVLQPHSSALCAPH